MALITDDEIPETGEVAETLLEPVITKKTSTVYTDDNITNTQFDIEGYAWQTHGYYSQLLGDDDSPRRLDLHLSPTLQQYVRVNNFVIMTEDNPTPSTDSQTITTFEGSGKIYPAVVPNAGDMLVGNLRDGRQALFVITHVERSNVYASTTWEVTFQMVDYHSNIYQQNLDIKVVEELYFDIDSKSCGDSALQTIPKEDVYANIYSIAHRWWDEFYDLKAEVAIVEIKACRYFDHMINRFVSEIIPYDIYRELPKLREYTIPANGYSKKYNTVWDIMAHGGVNQFDFLSKHVELLDRTAFLSGNIYTGVGYAQIDGIIHPSLQPSLYGMNAVDDGIGYLFSSHFYDKETTSMKKIELLVYKAIHSEHVSYEEILEVLKETMSDTAAENRFYSYPILLWLLIRLV